VNSLVSGTEISVSNIEFQHTMAMKMELLAAVACGSGEHEASQVQAELKKQRALQQELSQLQISCSQIACSLLETQRANAQLVAEQTQLLEEVMALPRCTGPRRRPKGLAAADEPMSQSSATSSSSDLAMPGNVGLGSLQQALEPEEPQLHEPHGSYLVPLVEPEADNVPMEAFDDQLLADDFVSVVRREAEANRPQRRRGGRRNRPHRHRRSHRGGAGGIAAETPGPSTAVRAVIDSMVASMPIAAMAA